MKKLLIAAAISAGITSSALAADTKSFEGFSAGLNLNLISGGIKISGDGGSFDGIGGKSTQSFSLDAAYGFKMGADSVLTLGADIALTKPKVFTGDFFGDGAVVKQKNSYGIYVAPGYAVSKEALVYAKLGYNKMKLEATSSDSTESASESFHGYSFGLGTKVMLSKTTFLKVEANRMTYSSKNGEQFLGDPDVNVKPSATVGTIGIGMNF